MDGQASIRAIEEAARDEGFLVIVAQPDADVESPKEKDIYWVGTLARVLKVFTLADGTRNVLVQGIRRVQLISVLQTEPFIHAVARDIDEENATGLEIDAMATNLKTQFRKAVELAPNLTEEQLSIVLSLEEPDAMADMIASMIPVDGSGETGSSGVAGDTGEDGKTHARTCEAPPETRAREQDPVRGSGRDQQIPEGILPP